MSDKKRALFVDDEPKVLRGLRRMLSVMRNEWEMTFANSGEEALSIMENQNFDVIISDMRMPGMSGVQLLNEVRNRHPQTVRLALSGQSSKESVLSSVGPIHQYLPKPCDLETIQFTLSRLWALKNLLSVPRLQALLAQLERLPSLPGLYNDLMREIRSPHGSLKGVARIVGDDLGMSAKVLQLVNSAFFGSPRHVSDPSQAVTALGMDIIKALAISVCVFSPFEERAVEHLRMEPLWQHSLSTGALAKKIADDLGLDEKTADQAFISGLLHDVGKLVYAALLPEEYHAALERVRNEAIGVAEAEQDVMGATHAEMGAYLLGLWGFADPIMKSVAFHHCPQACPDTQIAPLTAVHVANVLVSEYHPTEAVHSHAQIDTAYLAGLGLTSHLERWHQLCETPQAQEVT